MSREGSQNMHGLVLPLDDMCACSDFQRSFRIEGYYFTASHHRIINYFTVGHEVLVFAAKKRYP